MFSCLFGNRISFGLSFQPVSRKTKSRGRRSTVHASRSLEMFQQSLAENSSQEESRMTEPVTASEEPAEENETGEGKHVSKTKESETQKESGNEKMT